MEKMSGIFQVGRDLAIGSRNVGLLSHSDWIPQTNACLSGFDDLGLDAEALIHKLRHYFTFLDGIIVQITAGRMATGSFFTSFPQCLH